MKYQARQVLIALLTLCCTFVPTPFNVVMADAQDDFLKAMIANKAAIKAGRAKAQTCTRCHGRDGIHQLAVRAGWNDTDGQFVIVKLREFRDGKVLHQVMNAVASELDDVDIMQIALWVDSLAAKR